MKVDNRDVYVEMSVVWNAEVANFLKSKVRSVSMQFPTVTVDQGISKVLKDPKALQDAQLRLLRNGRAYSEPLATKMNSTLLLRGRIIYELGPSFLGNWQFPAVSPPSIAALQTQNTATAEPRGQQVDSEAGPSAMPDKDDLSSLPASVGKSLTPVIELVVSGQVVGRGTLPPVAWDEAQKSGTNLADITSQLATSVQGLPAMVPLYSIINSSAMVGTSQTLINVNPPSSSAFWIAPSKAEDIVGGQNYSFAWSVHGGQEETDYEFMLTAMGVGGSGELVPTDWKHGMKLACSFSTGVKPARYTGGVAPCVFQHEVAIPASLSGHNLVMVIGWLDSLEQRHEMISPAFRLVETAPTQTASHAAQGMRKLMDHGEAWGSQSLGSATGRGFGPKVTNKLDKLRDKACGKEPLKYSLGAGMNFVEHMRNMVMSPMGMSTVGESQSPDFTSDPVPIFRLGERGNNGTKLSDILPKSICAGGVCEGMMPGCQDTKVNPINIKQIVFKLSRLFKWKRHFGPKMRHAVAYGLALFPSALEVGNKQIVSNKALGDKAEDLARRMVTPLNNVPGLSKFGANREAVGAFSQEAASSRRLNANPASHLDDDDDDEEDNDNTEFDTFTARIKEPIHFDITERLMRTLIHRNAFRIEDGREAELGPIFIQDFELRDDAPPPPTTRGGDATASRPIVAALHKAEEKTESFGERTAATVTLVPHVGLLGTSAVGLAGLAFGATTLLGAVTLSLRRRGYSLLGPQQRVGVASASGGDVSDGLGGAADADPRDYA
jgi:hypothetical protein